MHTSKQKYEKKNVQKVFFQKLSQKWVIVLKSKQNYVEETCRSLWIAKTVMALPF